MTRNDNYYGIVDLVDILTLIVQQFGNFEFHSFESFETVYRSLKSFRETTVKQVVEMTSGQIFARSRDAILTDYSLFHAFEMCARGHYRLVVCDNTNNRKVCSLITQTMALSYIADHVELVNTEIRDRLVKEMTLHQGFPICVQENDRVLLAFSMLVMNSLNRLINTANFASAGAINLP